MLRIRSALGALFLSVPALAQPAAPAAPGGQGALPPPSTVAPPEAAGPEIPAPQPPPPPAAAAAEAPVASPPLAPPTPAPEPAAEPAEAPPPNKLGIGKGVLGTWQPSALIQLWLYGAREDGETVTTPRVRRAELRVKGEIIEDFLKFAVMIDPAKSLFSSRELPVEGLDPEPETPPTVTVVQPGNDRSILQDVILTFVTEFADISAGEFKTPVSYEGYNSSSQLLFPERARVSRRYGDRRDLGVKAEKKLGDYFFYNVGVYSGSGINTADEDNEKDVGVRLEAYPIEGLTVAAVGYTTVGERDENVRDRVEGDLRFDEHGVILQAEYIHAWDGPSRVEGHGAYGALGYTFLDKIQPIVRVGFLDTNLDQDVEADVNGGVSYEATLNYYLRGNEARLSLQGGVLDRPDLPNLTEIILLAQASF